MSHRICLHIILYHYHHCADLPESIEHIKCLSGISYRVSRNKAFLSTTFYAKYGAVGFQLIHSSCNDRGDICILYSISQEICTRFFALLCFVVVIHWLIFPYPSGLLHWHCGNLTIAPVPAKQPWWIWINTSCEFIMNDCITTTKQSTTKPCAYFLGYTILLSSSNHQIGSRNH